MSRSAKSPSNHPIMLLPNVDLGSMLVEVLSQGKPFEFHAFGWSMAPFIKPGDKLKIVPFNKQQPGVGDVVAFYQPERGLYLVHRIIHRQGKNYRLKGDNMSGKDSGMIPLTQIFGVVSQVTRDGKPVSIGILWGNRWVALLSKWGWLSPLIARLFAGLFRKQR